MKIYEISDDVIKIFKFIESKFGSIESGELLITAAPKTTANDIMNEYEALQGNDSLQAFEKKVLLSTTKGENDVMVASLTIGGFHSFSNRFYQGDKFLAAQALVNMREAKK